MTGPWYAVQDSEGLSVTVCGTLDRAQAIAAKYQGSVRRTGRLAEDPRLEASRSTEYNVFTALDLPDRRAAAADMRRRGMTYRQIAEALGTDRRSVCRLLR